MQRRCSNSGNLNQKEESSGSRFAINYMGGSEEQNGSVSKGLPNIKLNNNNEAYSQSREKEQNNTSRKMSLAAKSGQMQVFNSLHTQNLNQAASRSEG